MSVTLASSQVEPPPWESPQWQEAVSQNPRLAPFFDNLESFVELPEGVKKLRELVLGVAMRGQLVEQDPNDEPAANLLARIETRRKELIDAGELRKPKKESILTEKEIPFSLPAGWAWIKLEPLMVKMGAGSTPLGGKKVYVDEGVMFLRSQNVWNDGLRLNDVARILPETHKSMSGTHVHAGDVLLNITGASIGRCALVPDDFDEANVSQHVAILRLIDKDLRAFLQLCVVSPFFQETIMRVQVGVSREGLSMTRLKAFPFPVPPLAEQRRIVSKVEGLMSLCDTLESQGRSRESVRERASRSVLASLTSASAPVPAGTSRATSTGETLQSSWQRLSDHFEVLLDQPESLADLRQSIHQLAVQGKLVPQDPNDQPASEILVGDVVDFMGGYAFKSEWFQKTPGIRLVRNQNIGHGQLDWSDTEYLPDDMYEEHKRFQLFPGDLVLSLNRPFISTGLKLSWITESDCPCLLVQRISRMRPDEELLAADYLFLWCNAPHFYEEAHVVPSSGVPYIATNRVAKMGILLPPLAEQKRIVSKVSVLLSQLDELSARLRSRQSTTDALLTALVHQILENAK